MNNKEPRNVYILTYPSFREDWVKIVKNGRPVDVHSKELDMELDNTAVACTSFLSPSCAYMIHLTRFQEFCVVPCALETFYKLYYYGIQSR